MDQKQDKRQDRLRRQRNRDTLKRMFAGEDLLAYSPEDTWYPQRRVITKDYLKLKNDSEQQEKKDELNTQEDPKIIKMKIAR